jgi:CubicO group peptidase (beta-lactamase class C family)
MVTFDRSGIRSMVEAGFSDLSRTKRVDSLTLFQAASISKAVTTIGALRLVEKGLLHLDWDVNDKLSGWKIPLNRYTRVRPVTLREILTHSAGLSVSGFLGYARGAPLPTLRQCLDGLLPANNAPIRVTSVPGGRFRYSGGGFVVLQLVMEDAAGERFGRIMKRLVLRPGGMLSSRFSQPLERRLWPRAAVAYDARCAAVSGGWHNYPELAAAGLWTTATDLAKLGVEIIRDVSGASDRLLSPHMARQMIARQKGHMGLGWGIFHRGRYTTFEHSGGNVGYRCHLCCSIDGPGVAVMTNSDAGEPLISSLLESVMGMAKRR